MIEPTSVGVMIKEAIRSGQTIMREIGSLLRDVDTELGDLGLASCAGAEVFFDVPSRSVHVPEGWLQASLGRLYGTGGLREVSSRVVAVEVHLCPALFDEAVLVLALGEGGEPVDGTGWYKRYNGGEWVLSLYQAKPDFGAEREWEPARSPAVLPDVQKVRSVVLPLASLTGREAIRTEIVARCRTWLKGTPVEASAA